MEILPIGKELDDVDKENLEEQGPETATGNARPKEKKRASDGNSSYRQRTR